MGLFEDKDREDVAAMWVTGPTGALLPLERANYSAAPDKTELLEKLVAVQADYLLALQALAACLATGHGLTELPEVQAWARRDSKPKEGE
jgi:hypothetical protein